MPTKLPYQFIDGLDAVPRDQLYRNFEEIQRTVNAITSTPVAGDTSGLHIKPARIGPSPAYGSAYAAIDHTGRNYMVGGNYAMLIDSTWTYINAPAGGGVAIRINNGDKIAVTTSWVTLQESEIWGSLYMRNNWIRVMGATGIYWQDYGGGWHMEDTSWLRAYGGKGVYTTGEIRADGVGFNARLVGFMGPSGAHGTGWAQFGHWAYRASSLHYGFMHNGGEALISADAIQLRYQNSWRLEVNNAGVRTNGVYISTRGASVYLKWDGDNTHRIWHNGTNDGIHTTSWSYVMMEAAAHDHATYCQAQTRHVNRANNAWRYSDAAGHTNFSDPRGKRDMVEMREALGKQRGKLKEIRPIRFKFRPELADPEGDRDHFGFSADQLPREVIHEREMADGRVDKLFNPAGVLALLWQIVDELDDAVEALAARVTALERIPANSLGRTS